MGDNFNQQEFYWNNQNVDMSQQQGFYEQDYNQFTNQPLEFNSNGEFSEQSFTQYPAGMYNPNDYNFATEVDKDELDEPPLLEELEIYPDRILEKVLAVLNPFHGHRLCDDAEYLTKDADLAGPIFFCILLAASLLLAGKTSFSYIYGFSLISCIFMYFLLSLMTVADNVFSLSTVSSVLGYCLIPVVILSLIGVIFILSGLFGIILATICVIWASFSASRLFVAISGDKEQQPLIMYPAALVYGVFTLLVVF